MARRSRGFVMRVITSLAMLSGAARHAVAQAPGVPAVQLSDGELDALDYSHKWLQLGAALTVPGTTQDQFFHRLEWMKRDLDGGGGFLVALLYARDLWAVGDQLKIADPNKDPRLPAALQVLYAYELIQIDGAKCADRTAPSRRAEQLITSRAPTLAFLKVQPAVLKTRVVDLAIAYETQTAPIRRADDLLCRGGVEEFAAATAAGTAPPAPSGSGGTVEVEAPADWVPKMLDATVYGPAQVRARADMKASLMKLAQ